MFFMTFYSIFELNITHWGKTQFLCPLIEFESNCEFLKLIFVRIF